MPTLCFVEVTHYATDTSDFYHILHDDRGPPCHHCTTLTFLDHISSLATRGRQKFGWKCPHRGKLFIILSFIELKQPNLAEVCIPRMRRNPVNFVRIVQVTRPLGATILVKFQFLLSFGAVNPHPWADQGEILLAKFHLDRCNVLPLRGEKPKNLPASKNNTIRLRFVPPASKNAKPHLTTEIKPVAIQVLGYSCWNYKSLPNGFFLQKGIILQQNPNIYRHKN